MVENNRDHLDAEIPKRPPHDLMWCEYGEDLVDPVTGDPEMGGGDAFRSGLLCRKVKDFVSLRRETDRCLSDGTVYPLMASWHKNNEKTKRDQAASLEVFRSFDEAWECLYFSRLQHACRAQDRPMLGRLFQVDLVLMCLLAQDSTRCAFTIRKLDTLGKLCSSLVPVWGTGVEGEYNCVPLLVASSLLHCKNVRTQEEGTLPRGDVDRLVRRGHARRRSHRVLHIDVPGVREIRVRSTDESSKRDVALHIVRGHFCKMVDERFSKQGEWYWRHAHMRGTPSAGVADGPRVVVTRNA